MGEEVDSELDFIKATKYLDGYTIEDRERYVFETIRSFSESVKKIMEVKGGIKQAKAIKQLSMELKGEMGEELVICCLYGVKREYRVLFIEILRVVTGIQERIVLPESMKKE